MASIDGAAVAECNGGGGGIVLEESRELDFVDIPAPTGLCSLLERCGVCGRSGEGEEKLSLRVDSSWLRSSCVAVEVLRWLALPQVLSRTRVEAKSESDEDFIFELGKVEAALLNVPPPPQGLEFGASLIRDSATKFNFSTVSAEQGNAASCLRFCCPCCPCFSTGVSVFSAQSADGEKRNVEEEREESVCGCWADFKRTFSCQTEAASAFSSKSRAHASMQSECHLEEDTLNGLRYDGTIRGSLLRRARERGPSESNAFRSVLSISPRRVEKMLLRPCALWVLPTLSFGDGWEPLLNPSACQASDCCTALRGRRPVKNQRILCVRRLNVLCGLAPSLQSLTPFKSPPSRDPSRPNRETLATSRSFVSVETALRAAAEELAEEVLTFVPHACNASPLSPDADAAESWLREFEAKHGRQLHAERTTAVSSVVSPSRPDSRPLPVRPPVEALALLQLPQQLSFVPPLCVCASEESAEKWSRKNCPSLEGGASNESREMRDENENKSDDKKDRRNNSGWKGGEELPSLCSNRACGGLLYVPFSFIEFPLARGWESLSAVSRKMALPPNTQLFLGSLRSSCICCCRDAKTERLCLRSLRRAGLGVAAIVYRVDLFNDFKAFGAPCSGGSIASNQKAKTLGSGEGHVRGAEYLERLAYQLQHGEDKTKVSDKDKTKVSDKDRPSPSSASSSSFNSAGGATSCVSAFSRRRRPFACLPRRAFAKRKSSDDASQSFRDASSLQCRGRSQLFSVEENARLLLFQATAKALAEQDKSGDSEEWEAALASLREKDFPIREETLLALGRFALERVVDPRSAKRRRATLSYFRKPRVAAGEGGGVSVSGSLALSEDSVITAFKRTPEGARLAWSFEEEVELQRLLLRRMHHNAAPDF